MLVSLNYYKSQSVKCFEIIYYKYQVNVMNIRAHLHALVFICCCIFAVVVCYCYNRHSTQETIFADEKSLYTLRRIKTTLFPTHRLQQNIVTSNQYYEYSRSEQKKSSVTDVSDAETSQNCIRTLLRNEYMKCVTLQRLTVSFGL